tara:strand:+ start:548 stop:949 length:402 start_codon:yes stop_codon:yes gene_type:complete
MNHINLTEDFRNSLLESSNWDKIGLALETDSVVEEVVEEGNTVQAEEEAPEEEMVLEALSEEQDEVLNVLVEEALNADVFFHLFEKFASVLDASDHIQENYSDYEEDDVLAAALCEVFPNNFSLEEDEDNSGE